MLIEDLMKEPENQGPGAASAIAGLRLLFVFFASVTDMSSLKHHQHVVNIISVIMCF